MILAYVTRVKEGVDFTDLCILPDKPDMLTIPTSVFLLTETTHGVYRIGPDEAFITNLEPDGGLSLQPLEPAGLYLTLNLPIRPGFRVRRIKLLRTAEGTCKVFYEKDKSGWEEYQANKQRI